MKLAHIVPLSLLSAIPDEQTTHLALSELVLTEPDYLEFYRQKRARGDLIILDNPVHEDRPTSLDRWLEAIELLRPTVAVIPDVIDSRDKTVANVMEAVLQYEIEGPGGVELMAVPHGETQQDWLSCALQLSSFPSVTWFGISLERRLKDDVQALHRRYDRIYWMGSYDPLRRLKLHLLGVSESASEFTSVRAQRRATSADTSKFATWAMLKQSVLPPVPIHKSYPGRGPFGGSWTYFYAPRPSGISPARMKRNLARWCEYAERGA